ncbi:class I SAM-dependent DNA methyltransferase [Bdellovibrionota bacterium]
MELKEYKKLHAEWYDLMNVEPEKNLKDINYYAKKIKEVGEPALEIGSGTGRVYVPLLEIGFDIVGIDNSKYMNERCLAACKEKGLKAEIHELSMLDFDLSREFSFIFLCQGGLGIFTSDKDINATFERVMAHLKPGGSFLFEFQPVSEAPKNDNRWSGNWVTGPNNVVISLRNNTYCDSKTHIWEQLFIFDKFRDGKLIETEVNERWGRYFTVEETVKYAKDAGFVDIKVTNWLTEDPPKEDSVIIAVQCRKPKG